MNPTEHVEPDRELRDALRALRRDVPPADDLWPGIAGRIGHARRQDTSVPTVARTVLRARIRPGARHWRVPLAVAASLVVALGIAWQLRTAPAPPDADPTAQLMLREAAEMTREYRAAWQPLDATRRAAVDASALHTLDRSAADVRAALHEDPDARFLFDRLQSLYARRLDLARRLATST